MCSDNPNSCPPSCDNIVLSQAACAALSTAPASGWAALGTVIWIVGSMAFMAAMIGWANAAKAAALPGTLKLNACVGPHGSLPTFQIRML